MKLFLRKKYDMGFKKSLLNVKGMDASKEHKNTKYLCA
jgi:hypothetical protein